MLAPRQALACLLVTGVAGGLGVLVPGSSVALAATATASPSPTDTPTATASPSDTATATVSPSPTSPTRSLVQVITLPSHDRGRTSRVVYVYRPAVPDSATLPVLYLLHGQFGTPADPFRAGMQRTLDALFASGLPPFVVAAPDGASANRIDDEWGDAADGADRLETFLQVDVLRAVEGSHPRDRAHRAVAGFSMGGYAAAFTAGLHVSTYGQMISLAGYFHPDDPQGVFPSSAQMWAHYPLGRAFALGHTRVLLMDCSREGDRVIRGEIGRMRAALARAGHPPGTVVTPGDHNWTWVQAQWPLMVRFLGQGWGQQR